MAKAREPELLMIRGDRLLLALRTIESFSWDASCTEEPKIPRAITQRFPHFADPHGNVYLLWWGDPDDPGLVSLQQFLGRATGIDLAYFAIEDIFSIFVGEWKRYCDEQEYLDVLNFFRAVASGELTEEGFKEVDHGE